MAWLPGWNSVETTTLLRNIFELSGIALFLVVVVFEFLAYFYGHRRDWLVEEAARVATIQRTEREHQANERHAAEITEFQARVAAAEKAAAEAKKQQAQRRLEEFEKQTLIAALSPYPGQKIIIASTWGDNEAKTYRNDFVEVFDAAKWDHDGPNGIHESLYTEPITRIAVSLPPAPEKGKVVLTEAIKVLIDTLIKLNLLDTKQAYTTGNDVPPGSVALIVGSIPRQPAEK